MRTALRVPFYSELVKILAVEGAKNSSVFKRKGELFFVATA